MLLYLLILTLICQKSKTTVICYIIFLYARVIESTIPGQISTLKNRNLSFKKMKKLISFTLVFILLSMLSFSQEEPKVTAKKASIEIYGFLRNEFYYDSYKGLNAAMDNFYVVPLYKGKDAAGEPVNQQGIANYTAMATRFGMNIKGPELLGAKSSANFETDFAGIVSEYPEVLRLRKAYIQLDWKNSTLLTGQTWHPLWNGSGAFFPKVASLNTGSPFNPFNRSPQVDFDYRIGKVTISATALYEQQYVSKGFYITPNTNSKNLPKRNAVIPEMVLGLYYNSGGFSTGLAGQYNAVKPIDITDKNYVTNELNTSMIGMGYVGYRKNKLFVLAKGLVGQNMVNMCMLGGYGVKTYDTTTGEMTYTNYNNYTALFNIVYGQKVQVGLFTGIYGNMGTTDELYNFEGTGAKLACTLNNVKSVFRLSPHISYNIKNLNFFVEYEMTSADYGVGTFNFANGLYSDKENATNNRLLLMVMYNF